jgi:hypothetical protein
MTGRTYNKLDEALTTKIYNTIMEGPGFQMAIGAKNLKDGRLLIG